MQISAAVCASPPSHANWFATAEKEGWELGVDDAFSIHVQVRGATHLSSFEGELRIRH